MLYIILYMFYSCRVLAIITVIIFIILKSIKKAKTKTWQICCFFAVVVRSFFSLVLFSAFRCIFALFHSSANSSHSVTVALMCIYTD